MHLDWAIALAGAGVGFIVGLTGMGGGALMTPLLVLVFGITPSAAVASDLVAAVIMKPVGGFVHLRKGTVNLRLVAWLMLGSVPAAFVSVWALSLVDDADRIDSVIKVAVGVALLLASFAMVTKGAFTKRHVAAGAIADIHVHPGRTLAIGVFGGLVVGLTSVGSGSLMMVLLMLLYPTLVASELVGTDLVQAVPLVGSAALAHVIFGNVQLGLTTSLVIGAVPAVYLGAHVSARSADHVIRPILVTVLLLSSLKMFGVSTEVVGGVAVVLAAATTWAILRHRTAAAADAAAEAAGGAAGAGAPDEAAIAALEA
jgi:uncharacterized membrane protein YfcA